MGEPLRTGKATGKKKTFQVRDGEESGLYVTRRTTGKAYGTLRLHGCDKVC